MVSTFNDAVIWVLSHPDMDAERYDMIMDRLTERELPVDKIVETEHPLGLRKISGQSVVELAIPICMIGGNAQALSCGISNPLFRFAITLETWWLLCEALPEDSRIVR